jgi:hypothetical protein
MQAVCPITDKRIDEHVSRVNAFITVLLVVSFILFHFWVGMVFISLDFIIRGFFDSKFSPVCLLSKQIISILNLKGKLINAGPKIFAAQVGMALSVICLAFYFNGMSSVSIAVASLLAVFSFMESVFGYCVACKLYPIFRRIN